MKRSILTAFAIGLFTGLLLWPLVLIKMPRIWDQTKNYACVLVDAGRWSSEAGQCIQRDCYTDRTCGHVPRLSAQLCDMITVGDPLTHAYFLMGKPVKIIETTYHWQWNRETDEGPIAKVENGRLSSFTCTPPQSVLAQSKENEGSLFGGFRLPFSDKNGNIMD